MTSLRTELLFGKMALIVNRRQNRFEATSVANRFEELSKMRSEKRSLWEAKQATNPTEFEGTCQDMCPEFERHEREAHFDVSPFEILAGTERVNLQPGEHPCIDHRRAVKKYHRPAAGLEAPLPEDIRTIDALRRSMNYLLDEILDKSPEPFSEKHKYVRDRTRSIRQDIIVQQRALQKDPQKVLKFVRIHEEIARFHILSGHRLCGMEFSDFDPFQNTEQLRKVLQSLQEYYTDIRKSLTLQQQHGNSILIEALGNEAEFRSYQLLTHAEDQDVFRQALAFPHDVFASKSVQFALRCVSAFHQKDYIRYFLMARDNAEYLQGCLLHTHFSKLRKDAMRIIGTAYTGKESLPVSALCRWLFIEDQIEANNLVESFGWRLSMVNGVPFLSFATGGNGFSSSVDGDPFVGESPSVTPKTAFMSKHIEGKVDAMPVSKIIRLPNLVACGMMNNQIPVQQLPIAQAPQVTVPFQQLQQFAIPQQQQFITPTPAIQKKLVIDESTVKIMSQNLIDWFVSEQVPHICRSALEKEHGRRSTLKRVVIDKISRQVVDTCIRDICKEIISSTVEGMLYRRQVISQMKERIVNDLIRDCVKSEIKAISKQILISINVIKAPVMIEEQKSISGFTTPMTATPKRSRKKTPIKPLDIRYLDDTISRDSSLWQRVKDFSEKASNEKIESSKLQELLNKAMGS